MRAVHTGWFQFIPRCTVLPGLQRGPLCLSRLQKPHLCLAEGFKCCPDLCPGHLYLQFYSLWQMHVVFSFPLPLAPAYFPMHRQVMATHLEGFNKLAGGLGKRRHTCSKPYISYVFPVLPFKAVNQVSSGGKHCLTAPCNCESCDRSFLLEWKSRRHNGRMSVFENYQKGASLPVFYLSWTFRFNGSFGKVDWWAFRRAWSGWRRSEGRLGCR